MAGLRGQSSRTRSRLHPGRRNLRLRRGLRANCRAGYGRRTACFGPRDDLRIRRGSRPGADHRDIRVSRDEPTRILDPRADEVLRAASRLLAATNSFAFEAEERFDEIPSGQPRTLLTNVRRVAVQRPNRFAADAEGDTLSRSVWFDGRNVSVYDRAQHVHASIATPGSIDAALDVLADRNAAAVPPADSLYGDPYAVLTENVTYSRYLGLHRASGVLSHHLVFAQPTIEWQIRIDAGEQPLTWAAGDLLRARAGRASVRRRPDEVEVVADIARRPVSLRASGGRRASGRSVARAVGPWFAGVRRRAWHRRALSSSSLALWFRLLVVLIRPDGPHVTDAAARNGIRTSTLVPVRAASPR